MSPRPILKPLEAIETTQSHFPFASRPTVILSPHVHFPPTPMMTSTFSTHSPNTYDRAPITVSSNSCALPERGERTLDDEDESPITPKGSYFHPRAFEACEREIISPPNTTWAPPHLTHDSSESDDSDDLVLTPPDPCSAPPHSIIPSSFSTKATMENALAFLPHPPSPVKEGRNRRGSFESTVPRPRRSPFCSNSETSLLLDDGPLGGF